MTRFDGPKKPVAGVAHSMKASGNGRHRFYPAPFAKGIVVATLIS